MKTILSLINSIAIVFLCIVDAHTLWASKQPRTSLSLPAIVNPSPVNPNSPNKLAHAPLDTLDIAQNLPATAAIISKPKLLEAIPATDLSLLGDLDALVTKQQSKLTPYVPFIQSVFVAIDYSALFINAYQHIVKRLIKKNIQPETQYEFGLGLLFRKNIQLSSNLGFAHLQPAHTIDNHFPYKVQGMYGRIGLDYVLKYNAQDNLYLGFRYGRSHFKNTTQPTDPHTKSISKALRASWFEFVIGGTSPLCPRHGLSLGFLLHIRTLAHYMPFRPANNYVIPGYGRTKNRPSLGLSLYIQYNLSFLDRFITFN